MVDQGASGQASGEAPVLGRLADFPDGAATCVAYRKRGREAALVLVRRGDELRAYEDACPHQWLPLTYRGSRVLSEDKQRLRCANHAAEFAVEDGRALCGPGDGTGLVPVPLRVTPDGSVLIDSWQVGRARAAPAGDGEVAMNEMSSVASVAIANADYMSGFGNGFETEALPGALPVGRNSPQKCPYGLYAEQLSGSPFTAPRTTNERSWLYRIRPTVAHWGEFKQATIGQWHTAPAPDSPELPIAPLRWDPLPIPDQELSFLEGIRTITTAGDAHASAGMGAHVYLATRSMQDEYFYDADGELLFVPQQGALRLWTEFGIIDVGPGEIAVIPRGVKLRVELRGGPARGYLCENYGGAFTLPERGPIGANCMANPRDFLTPVAAYEDREAPGTLYVKWGGQLWATVLDRSPLDVVAWHGNYAPYKYDLRRYSPVGPILFDHADPSIFTVLTSPSETPGTANIDFVLFSDRWLVAENTFRPPWYHMNVMSEFMGLVYGVYDAKTGGGFVPGGVSLHNTMLPHGPDRDAFEKASNAPLAPHKLEGTLAFMFETRFPQRVTPFAAEAPELQKGYGDYGRDLAIHFDPTRP